MRACVGKGRGEGWERELYFYFVFYVSLCYSGRVSAMAYYGVEWDALSLVLSWNKSAVGHLLYYYLCYNVL